MSQSEMIARLNVKNVRFDVGSGGIPEITPELIAGACAGMSQGAYTLARAIHCGEASDAIAFLKQAKKLSYGLAERSGWNRNELAIEGIAVIACFLVMNPARCTWCHGTKFNGHGKPCQSCGGTGNAKDPSMRELADIAEMDSETYRKRWHVRAMRLLSEMQVWMCDVERVLKRQLE